MKTIIAVLALLIVPFASNQEGPSDFRRVSSKEVLDQLDVAILMYDIQKKPSAETLNLVKRIIALNEMQIQDAEQREYYAQHPDARKAPLAAFGDLRRPFYELRDSICKDYSGILVDLDGQAKAGTCH